MFRLGEHPPSIIDGVVVYLSQHIDDEDVVNTIYRIVDDKNLPGDSLAARRLILAKEGVLLKRINRAVFFLGDLIKLAKSSTWFIDARGNTFTYKKSRRVKLVYKKIVKCINIPTGGSIIEVENIPQRFKCLYTPKVHEKYAIVLVDKATHILYGFSETLNKDSWRMI